MSASTIKRIAVIGAGTVGLSAAARLKEEYGDGVEVTVIAEAFYNQTTSYGSGGLWEPYQIAGTAEEQVNLWGKLAFDHFLSLLHGPDAGASGTQLLTAYQLFTADQEYTIPSWKDIVFSFSELSQEDLRAMGLPSRFVKGFTFGTLVIEQKYYLKFLTDKLTDAGVSFVQRKIEDIQELIDGSNPVGSFDAIINCTGLGSAKSVVHDEEMYPIRGQVLRVKAPWINNVWFFGTSYIIPNVDTVVLGGTAQKGNWDTTVSLADTEKILGDIAEVFPSIRDAPIENVWAGLRPGRTPLRLESEVMSGHDGHSVLVVHCYGHGGKSPLYLLQLRLISALFLVTIYSSFQ
jgi:D-amino-acid oxidase